MTEEKKPTLRLGEGWELQCNFGQNMFFDM